jgi:hypothetical protein
VDTPLLRFNVTRSWQPESVVVLGDMPRFAFSASENDESREQASGGEICMKMAPGRRFHHVNHNRLKSDRGARLLSCWNSLHDLYAST